MNINSIPLPNTLIKTDTNNQTNSSNNTQLNNKLNVQNMGTDEEMLKKLEEKSKELNTKHNIEPSQTAKKSFETIDNELTTIQKDISTQNPNIKNDSWDFVYKNGKFNVVSDQLSSADKSFVEDKLNNNFVLNESAKNINTAVINYYQHTPEDGYTWSNGKGGSIVFNNVSKQLDKGILPFKEMINDVKKDLKPGEGWSDGPFHSIIDSAKKYLTPSVDTYA